MPPAATVVATATKEGTDAFVSQISYLLPSTTEAKVESVQTPAKNVAPPSAFAQQEGLSNLTSAKAGARILFATDEWFAAADNLLDDGPPTFVDDLFCQEGKVMDGWETRRRREAGHDWCLIKLSRRGHVVGIEVDTAHFTGNHVPRISLEIANLTAEQEAAICRKMPGALERLLDGGGLQGSGFTPDEVAEAERTCRDPDINWTELLPVSPLRPGYEESRIHVYKLDDHHSGMMGTHVRLNYFPDGGVARLRLWGDSGARLKRCPSKYCPVRTGRICTFVPHETTGCPPSQEGDYRDPELSCEDNGGKGIVCSNSHYGTPSNLIQASLGQDMGDGWETARHPERPSVLVRDPKTNLVDSPLKDWAILKLGRPAVEGVSRIILDTKHFRGNYPESVKVEGCFVERGMTDEVLTDTEGEVVEWFPLLERTRMGPDAEHVFESNLGQLRNETQAVTHVRVSIYPDGGISRVRIYGKVTDQDDEDAMRSNL